jgi:hypothetical protein
MWPLAETAVIEKQKSVATGVAPPHFAIQGLAIQDTMPQEHPIQETVEAVGPVTRCSAPVAVLAAAPMTVCRGPYRLPVLASC